MPFALLVHKIIVAVSLCPGGIRSPLVSDRQQETKIYFSFIGVSAPPVALCGSFTAAGYKI